MARAHNYRVVFRFFDICFSLYKAAVLNYLHTCGQYRWEQVGTLFSWRCATTHVPVSATYLRSGG